MVVDCANTVTNQFLALPAAPDDSEVDRISKMGLPWICLAAAIERVCQKADQLSFQTRCSRNLSLVENRESDGPLSRWPLMINLSWNYETATADTAQDQDEQSA